MNSRSSSSRSRAWRWPDTRPHGSATRHRSSVRSSPARHLQDGEEFTLSPLALVPASTDFKLDDITDPAGAEAAEPLDMNQRAGSSKVLAGNRKFLTRRL